MQIYPAPVLDERDPPCIRWQASPGERVLLTTTTERVAFPPTKGVGASLVACILWLCMLHWQLSNGPNTRPSGPL